VVGIEQRPVGQAAFSASSTPGAPEPHRTKNTMNLAETYIANYQQLVCRPAILRIDAVLVETPNNIVVTSECGS
jgi:hypothetical protein